MDDFLKEALEIVKAQAAHRVMTEAEITDMVVKLAKSIKNISGGCAVEEGEAGPAIDAKKAIKEKSITCCECGKSFKIITKKHLASHDLTPVEYKAKHGYKKTQPLSCKALGRARKEKMSEMKLWERRGKGKAAKAAKAAKKGGE